MIRETSLPGGIQKFMFAQSDVIINGYWGRKRKEVEDRDRLMSFDGTNEVMAGTRIRGAFVPRKYIVTPPTISDSSLPWKQWQGFFKNTPAAGQEAQRFYEQTYRGRLSDLIDDDEKDIIRPGAEAQADITTDAGSTGSSEENTREDNEPYRTRPTTHQLRPTQTKAKK
jgi:hypothetical protein